MLVPGSKVDRYVVEGAIGQGGMGAVYRALDTRLRRRVALKVVHGDPSTMTREKMARMMREARTVAALSHPNVVTIFDVGESEGFPFLAMEMLKGSTLRSAMHDESATIPRKLRWLLEVADALGAAHRMGIIHRDIKPENVMVLDTDSVKVLDFGIARVEDAERHRAATGDAAPSSFRTAGVAGTPKYMAPEHHRGDKLDARADQFAWGLVAYEILAMRHPRDELPEFSAAMDWSMPARALTEVAPAVPEKIASVVMRALERDRDKRWPSMDHIVEALVGAEPALESARPRRSASEPEVELAPARPGPAQEVTTVPVSMTQASTAKVVEPKLERVEEPAALAPKAPAARRTRTVVALGAVALCVAGYLLVSGGASSHLPSAAPRCALDEATNVIALPMSSFGIVVSGGGALLAGSAQRSGTEMEYAAVARLPEGKLDRKLPYLEDVGPSFAYPTQGSEPLVAVFINNSRGGAFGITEPEPPDGGFSKSRDRAMASTPFGAQRLIAKSAGETVFAAIAALSYREISTLPSLKREQTDYVTKVGSFAFVPGQITKGILDHEGTLIALAATRARGAALISHGEELRVVFFDVTAQPLGPAVVIGPSGSKEGAVAFDGDELVAIWREPAGPGSADYWQMSRITTRATPPRTIPGSEGALGPDLVVSGDGFSAVWAQRGVHGSELRFARAKDPMDLTRASVVLRATEEPLRDPRLAVRGDERWVAWQEGTGNQVRAARIRCE